MAPAFFILITMPGTARVSKEKGELAEAAFLHRATELGFIVSKPWGDSAKYDFIVEGLGRISRVQVKSCATCSADPWPLTPSDRPPHLK